MSNSKMGLVYSEPQMAIDGGLDYFYEQEEDVYVVPVFYPSGVEYVLKKEKDVIGGCNCLKRYSLTENHRFSTLKNALKAVQYFKKRGKRFCVKKKMEEESGYKFVKYYYLCST